MKTMFWGLFAIGFVACSTVGIGPALKRAGGDWLSPTMLAGIVLGLAILALAAAFAFGVRPGVLASDGVVLGLLGGLIGLKVLVGLAQIGFAALARG